MEKLFATVKFPGIGVAVTVQEAPLQLVCGQRVEMELILVVDAAANGLDNLLRKLVGTGFVAAFAGSLHYLA